MRIQITDRVAFSVNSSREYLDNGYLRVPGRVARTGIQQYSASELGLTDRPPGSIVNVYRPPDAVFDLSSLESYDNADVTVEHPSDLVDSTSFKTVSVGHAISGGRRDGDFVVVDFLIKDQEAIDAIDGGKAELSAGYTAEYIKRSGVAPDGQHYEFVQDEIVINHVALCDRARAGKKARLFDNNPIGVKSMPKVTLDNGVMVEVADENSKTIIQSTIDGLKKRVKDAEEEKEAAEARADAKDEELEEMKNRRSEDAISKRLGAVMAASDSAVKIAGKDFSCDSLDPLTIKRKALDAAGIKCKKFDSWDKAPEAYVSAYFDAEEERREAEDENEEEARRKAEDSVRQLGADLSKRTKSGDANFQRDSVYQNFLDKRYGRKTQEGN